MKILNAFSAMLIALQVTPSISAPVSRNAGLDLVERQSQTSAQGDCTSQSVNGQPPTVSGNCAQGNTGGTYNSGGISPADGSGNRNTTSSGGTTGTSEGTLTGNTGGTTTGNGYGTTGSGQGTKGSDGVSNTNSRQGTNGSNGVSNTKGLKFDGNTAFPLSDGFTNKLKGESFGNVALPQLDEIISSVQSEVPGGEIPGGDITVSRKRDLASQAESPMS